MILAIDVYYYPVPDEEGNTYCVGCVLFNEFDSILPEVSVQSIKGNEFIAPYVPGHFKDRELPCIMKAFNQFKVFHSDIQTIILDSYVCLKDSFGNKIESLGDALHKELVKLGYPDISIIGVAKTLFGCKNNTKIFDYCKPVYRGVDAKTPLYVTSIGCNLDEAAEKIKNMHGPNKIPYIISLADQYSKKYKK